jgi:hypothetical protein
MLKLNLLVTCVAILSLLPSLKADEIYAAVRRLLTVDTQAPSNGVQPIRKTADRYDYLGRLTELRRLNSTAGF